jgi:hypothetical protein
VTSGGPPSGQTKPSLCHGKLFAVRGKPRAPEGKPDGGPHEESRQDASAIFGSSRAVGQELLNVGFSYWMRLWCCWQKGVPEYNQVG